MEDFEINFIAVALVTLFIGAALNARCAQALSYNHNIQGKVNNDKDQFEAPEKLSETGTIWACSEKFTVAEKLKL